MINAVEIDDLSAVHEGSLLDRVSRGSSDRTREFLIRRDDLVVGLLIYERDASPYDFIYEIFVLDGFRRQGIGTWILSYAEQIATSLDMDGIRLKARSLYQDELNDADLTSWYKKKGYVQSALGDEFLEKRFTRRSFSCSI